MGRWDHASSSSFPAGGSLRWSGRRRKQVVAGLGGHGFFGERGLPVEAGQLGRCPSGREGRDGGG
jgi:hypothetical protein